MFFKNILEKLDFFAVFGRKTIDKSIASEYNVISYHAEFSFLKKTDFLHDFYNEN